jgi:hypothetical protein
MRIIKKIIIVIGISVTTGTLALCGFVRIYFTERQQAMLAHSGSLPPTRSEYVCNEDHRSSLGENKALRHALTLQ